MSDIVVVNPDLPLPGRLAVRASHGHHFTGHLWALLLTPFAAAGFAVGAGISTALGSADLVGDATFGGFAGVVVGFVGTLMYALDDKRAVASPGIAEWSRTVQRVDSLDSYERHILPLDQDLEAIATNLDRVRYAARRLDAAGAQVAFGSTAELNLLAERLAWSAAYRTRELIAATVEHLAPVSSVAVSEQQLDELAAIRSDLISELARLADAAEAAESAPPVPEVTARERGLLLDAAAMSAALSSRAAAFDELDRPAQVAAEIERAHRP